MPYHINKEGMIGKCTAEKRSCPLGEREPHFDSREEAQIYYESVNQNATFSPIQKIFSDTDMKQMDRQRLMAALLLESNVRGETFDKLAASIVLADALHEGQVRKEEINGRLNTPYIEHPLRNALRMVRMGVRDYHVLAAIVLHDTVEDCADKYQKYVFGRVTTEQDARKLLINRISAQFGEETAELVVAVTNPLRDSPDNRVLTVEEKHQIYRDHVVESMRGKPKVVLVKITDWLDNAGSLHWMRAEKIDKARTLASKYYPLVEEFRKELPSLKPFMTEEGHRALEKKLNLTEERLRSILGIQA